MGAKNTKLVIASDLLFLIPLAFAFFYNNTLQALAILIVILFSTLYHLYSDNELLGTLDVIAAFTLITVNLYLVIRGGFSWPFFYMALLLVPLSFYFLWNKDKNKYYFPLWHVVSVFITLFSLLSFV